LLTNDHLIDHELTGWRSSAVVSYLYCKH